MSTILTVLIAEIKRYYRVQWSHLGDSLSWFAYTFLMFAAAIAILNGITGGGYGKQEQLLVMVGWLAFVIASDIIQELPGIITEEAQTGTLEQIYLTSIPFPVLLGLRSMAFLIGSGVRGVFAFLILNLFVAPLRVGSMMLITFGITMIGVYGLGFLLAGISLVFKRADALVGLILSLMIFLTGSLVSLSSYEWIYAFSRYVLPLTWGIEIMRGLIIISPDSFEKWISNQSGLLIHSILYLLTGLVIFVCGFSQSRRDGSISHY